MGCSASKATEVVVAPMPPKPKDVQPKQSLNEKDADSLRGSQASIRSTSSRSDRENSARSTRTTDTTDSGVAELEEDNSRNIITEHSSEEEILKSKANDRPKTPELSIDGTPLKRRKSPKQRLMESRDSNNNSSNSSALPPLGVIERPQSRGGMAFDVMLYPNTGNVKNRPVKLQSLEKRKKRSKRRTKEEIEQKIIEAQERRKEHANQVIEKALSRKEKQLREAKALDEFAQRLEQQQES